MDVLQTSGVSAGLQGHAYRLCNSLRHLLCQQ